jgi:O-antigen/teichoic acid export membrane protein
MAEADLSLGKRMARGAAWMVALRSIDRGLGLVSTLFLVHLLLPDDFGIVALGMAIVGGMTVFSEFSLELALIQNQSAVRRHYDTAWTLGLLRGVLLTALLLLLAKPSAALLSDERLTTLVACLAILPFLEGFLNVGVVDFRKHLNFRKEFILRFSGRLAGVVATIALAFLWQDYWALVIGQAVNRTVRIVLSYRLHPYRPRLSLEAWRDLLHYSKWLFFNGIVLFGSQRGATFVVGAFLNPTFVGIFALAREISLLVSQAFIAPIKHTYFPGFSKISNDFPAMREVYLNAFGLVTIVALPASIGIGLTADIFVPFALGENWLDTIPIVEILSVHAVLLALQGPVRPVLLAIKRPDIVTKMSTVQTIFLLPALVIGTWHAGIVGAAWATVASRFLVTALEYYVLFYFLGLTVIDCFPRVWRTILSCGLMTATIFALKQSQFLSSHDDLVAQMLNLAIVVLCGTLTYALGIFLLWAIFDRSAKSAEGIILSVLREKCLGR